MVAKAHAFPCLRCGDGRVVKGVQFRWACADAGDPVALACRLTTPPVPTELVFLDIARQPSGAAPTLVELVRQTA